MAGRTILQLVRDRFRKHGLYDTAEYWDMKADSYQGLARSNWPSNAYNRHVHETQMEAIDRALGDVKGLKIADVGCGTGRTSRHLAQRGATVQGWDFSSRAIEAAKKETEGAGLTATFAVGDVLEPFPEAERGTFDVVLSLGCLTIACRTSDDLDRGLGHVASLLKPGGRLLFIEPIHRSPLLKRILAVSVDEWVDRCAKQGLEPRTRDAMLFVPARYALAFRDLPDVLTTPLFRAGEAALRASGLQALGDYKVLLFARRG